MEVPEYLKIYRTVRVTPVILENPVLKDIEIMCGEDISAGAEVLPESGAFKKTAAKITVTTKKMTKKQKGMLGKKLKRAGISKRVKVT